MRFEEHGTDFCKSLIMRGIQFRSRRDFKNGRSRRRRLQHYLFSRGSKLKGWGRTNSIAAAHRPPDARRLGIIQGVPICRPRIRADDRALRFAATIPWRSTRSRRLRIDVMGMRIAYCPIQLKTFPQNAGRNVEKSPIF